MTEHFLYIQSDESNDYFSENNNYKFKVHLNIPLTLQGFWKVALLEFHVKLKSALISKNALYVYSDLCKESIVHGEEKALLRRLDHNKRYGWDYVIDTPFYLPMKRKELREFEINIKHVDGSDPTYLNSPLNLTLHLKHYPFVCDHGSL